MEWKLSDFFGAGIEKTAVGFAVAKPIDMYEKCAIIMGEKLEQDPSPPSGLL